MWLQYTYPKKGTEVMQLYSKLDHFANWSPYILYSYVELAHESCQSNYFFFLIYSRLHQLYLNNASYHTLEVIFEYHFTWTMPATTLLKLSLNITIPEQCQPLHCWSNLWLLYLMLISSSLIGQLASWQFWMSHGNVTWQCLTAVKFIVEMGHSV